MFLSAVLSFHVSANYKSILISWWSNRSEDYYSRKWHGSWLGAQCTCRV